VLARQLDVDVFQVVLLRALNRQVRDLAVGAGPWLPFSGGS
jgi:hypothetical protein